MRELRITIEFITPCLGGERRDDCDRFARDPSGHRVMFMHTWWQKLLSYGADGLSRHQQAVRGVSFSPFVDGDVKVHDRYWRLRGGAEQMTRHEAFLAGDRVSVMASVPDEISIDDLKQILNYAGQYRGISPYKWETYGRFRAVEIKERYARTGQTVGQPAPDNPST